MLKGVLAKSRIGSLTEVTRGLFYRDARGKLITDPIVVGRFKEYYDNIQALAHKASVGLTEIYNELEKSGYADEEYAEEDQSQNLFSKKREEVWNILRFTTVDRFIQSLYENEYDDPDLKKIVNKLELIYANEVTFLFYLLIGRGPGKKKFNMFPDAWASFDETLHDIHIEFESSPSVELINILKKDISKPNFLDGLMTQRSIRHKYLI